MALASRKNGNATPAPSDTTTSGRSARRTAAAKRRFRSAFGIFRVVGANAGTTRSPASSERECGSANVTQSRSCLRHQGRN